MQLSQKISAAVRDMILLDMRASNGWSISVTWQRFQRNGEEMGHDFYAAYDIQIVGTQATEPQRAEENVLSFHTVLVGLRNKFWRLHGYGSSCDMQRFNSLVTDTVNIYSTIAFY
jgi:hypothetical protein